MTATIFWVLVMTANVKGGQPSLTLMESQAKCQQAQLEVPWYRQGWCVPLIKEQS